MKMKKTLLSVALCMAGCMAASAQGQEEKTEYVFNPHWYVQAQVGGQYTLGEIAFGKLLSPNVQIGAGYNFNKVVGARLSFNMWQSRGGSNIKDTDFKWKYNYVAPQADVTVNLSNLIAGYNPKRLVNVGVFGGIGMNIAFNNDEAATAAEGIKGLYPYEEGFQPFGYLWDGTKVRMTGRLGANVDFRITDACSIGLEVHATTLSDHYNSKRSDNSDWYFNALVGVKYSFGKTYTKKTTQITQAVVEGPVRERIVEKVVEKPVEVIKTVQEPLRRDIFFTIATSKIVLIEMQKVKEVADYLKKNPSAKVEVTGYADKGTGNSKINERLGILRAEAVVKALTENYGIAANRIISSSKGDTEQPYEEDVLNRVTICIAK